jgi:uncharacterized protein (DUF1778 family)
MGRQTKQEQLQLRVTEAEKATIHRAAASAGMDMSAYVLRRVLPVAATRFHQCVAACASEATSRFALAELNSLLSELTPAEMSDAVAAPPSVALTPFLENYVAAMVEYGCARCFVPAPVWTHCIAPLEKPAFGTNLEGLRLHLLTHSPPPFRLRNIFIDSSLGQRV